MEETTNVDTSNSNCNFPEEISKSCNNFVGNFHDLRDEIVGVNRIIIKKIQNENTQLKGTTANFYCKRIAIIMYKRSVISILI